MLQPVILTRADLPRVLREKSFADLLQEDLTAALDRNTHAQATVVLFVDTDMTIVVKSRRGHCGVPERSVMHTRDIPDYLLGSLTPIQCAWTPAPGDLNRPQGR